MGTNLISGLQRLTSIIYEFSGLIMQDPVKSSASVVNFIFSY